MKTAEKLVARIKGLKDKIEEASEKALEDGGFGDRVDEVRGWMAELDSAKKSLETLREGRTMLDSIRGLGDEPPEQAGAKSLGEHVVKMVGQRLAGLKGAKGSVNAPEWLGRKAGQCDALCYGISSGSGGAASATSGRRSFRSGHHR